MDWVTLLTVCFGFFSILSTTIGLFLYLASKIDGMRHDINQEMKDFHGRLERQDAEFKAHLMYSHAPKS